jgi:hypothetical protein
MGGGTLLRVGAQWRRWEPHIPAPETNVEMRRGVGTLGNAFVNVHLPIYSDDPDHVAQIKRVLSHLTSRRMTTCSPVRPRDYAFRERARRLCIDLKR